MKRIPSKTRVELILAGIREIRVHGIQNFSVRRIAADCGVSWLPLPTSIFKNKNDYILAILHYINEQWHQVERQILADPPDSLREQLVRISIAYIRFLQENPHYRAIIMQRDENLNLAQIREKSSLSACAHRLVLRYCRSMEMSERDRQRKTFVVPAPLFTALPS